MTLLTGRRVVVVGSGPAGVSCAWALGKLGAEVIILDVGMTADPIVRDRYRLLGQVSPEQWDPKLVNQLRGEFDVRKDNLPLKPVLGSLHPYATKDPSAPENADEVGSMPSLAQGGLSTVWGAAMLPYRTKDLVGWPIQVEELAPFYRMVLEYVPLAGRHDALEAQFPLYTDHFSDLETTVQIGSFLSKLERNSKQLEANGVLAGRSRLAVRTASSQGGRGCENLGLCLHGCPIGSIWSANQVLGELRARFSTKYVPGYYVEAISESPKSVQISAITKGGNVVIDADQVFLATGPLSSTRIILRSLDAVGQEVELNDSQYYSVPLVTKGSGEISIENQGNTLAQAFLEVDYGAKSGAASHIQVYGFNDMMLREVARIVRLSPRLLERYGGRLLSKVLYCQGYLHSDESMKIRARLEFRNGRSRLDLSRSGSSHSVSRNVGDVLYRLRKAAIPLGAVPVTPLLQVWEPGRGMHSGGSFPMKTSPSGLESDLLGRPAGLRRVHVVDSSVFPTVPPPTITFSIMANACRIATLAGSEL